MRKGLIGCATMAALCASCSAGVKRTDGMKLYSAGNYSAAIPALEREVAAGEVSARYSLGLAYKNGTGVAPDPVKAEVLLTGAAIGGDPRAVSEVRSMLASPRCDRDTQLRNHWGSVGLMYRNLVTGVVELNTAPPAILVKMADIYDRPCPGAPVQPEAARSLRGLAGGPRHMWIYIPG